MQKCLVPINVRQKALRFEKNFILLFANYFCDCSISCM